MPSRYAFVVAEPRQMRLRRARPAIAFHSGRASISSTVSNVCGCSPGPGMLCTRRPGSSVTASGVTGGADARIRASPAAGTSGGGSSAKARYVSAATPGPSR